MKVMKMMKVMKVMKVMKEMKMMNVMKVMKMVRMIYEKYLCKECNITILKKGWKMFLFKKDEGNKVLNKMYP